MADVYTQQADVNTSVTGVGALTLAQAILLEKDTLTAGVMELFIKDNPIAQRLPIEEISGNSNAYDYEKKLPGVGFRAVNEGYTVTHGRVGQRAVTLAIFGGDLDVDRFIIKTRSSLNNQRAVQESMQVKAMSLTFQKYFFDGDRATSGNEQFDGVNLLLADTYHTASGAAGRDMASAPTINSGNGWTASGNSGQIRDVLDEAVDDVIGGESGKVIIANKTFRRGLTKACRGDGQVQITKDEYGYQLTNYNGIPILEIEDDAEGNAILGFDETTGTSDVTASFYVARFGMGYVQGIQNGGMDVRDLGELQEQPLFRTRVEWFVALQLSHPRCLKRVKGLTGV